MAIKSRRLGQLAASDHGLPRRNLHQQPDCLRAHVTPTDSRPPDVGPAARFAAKRDGVTSPHTE